MFDSLTGTQILLSAMIVLLGTVMTVVGVQLFFVLKDLRKNLERTDRILADVEILATKAVTEQEYVDEILLALKSMVGSLSTATSSVSTMTNKVVGPASMGLAMFQAVSTMMQKHRTREEERQRHGQQTAHH